MELSAEGLPAGSSASMRTVMGFHDFLRFMFMEVGMNGLLTVRSSRRLLLNTDASATNTEVSLRSPAPWSHLCVPPKVDLREILSLCSFSKSGARPGVKALPIRRTGGSIGQDVSCVCHWCCC